MPLVLVVDDENLSRRMLTRQLEKAGYDVLEAADGETALELIREREPTVVLSDWMMPGMSGLDLCREVKDDPYLQSTYFVVLTAKDGREDLISAFDAGADDYVRKPWDKRELMARLRAGIRIEELRFQLESRNSELGKVMKRLTREMDTVSDMQKAMLPQRIPDAPALDFTAWYLPSSECGGDYYDVLQLDATRQGFLVADVSGHGAPAMVAMALLRYNFHRVGRDFMTPGPLLEEMNRDLYDFLPTEHFATMFYAIIDTETMLCEYASAGHNPPFWYSRERGSTTELPNCKGFPLKLVTRDATYMSSTIQLGEGDKLVLYTDGVPECFNPAGEAYEMERFTKVVDANVRGTKPRQVESEIVADVMRFTNGNLPDDDMTLVIIGVREELL